MRKGDLTRTAILDEALQTASLVGFTGLSIGKLAEQTEMSKSGLFAHFKSMDQLQLQVMQRARERFVDSVVRPALAGPRGVGRIRALFASWLEWSNTALVGGCIFVAASVELDDRPGQLRDSLVQAERDWLELLANVAGTAVTEGEFATDLDTGQFAFEVHALMLGHHHATRLLRDQRATTMTNRAFESIIAAARAHQ